MKDPRSGGRVKLTKILTTQYNSKSRSCEFSRYFNYFQLAYGRTYIQNTYVQNASEKPRKYQS